MTHAQFADRPDGDVFDTRLSGGSVVLDDGSVTVCDLYIRDGVIAAYSGVASPLRAREVVDCGGLHLLPGVIDPHVHLGSDATYARTPEDVGRETRAAVAGGVTTMLVYALADKPYSTFLDGVIALTGQASYIDFGMHLCVSTAEQLSEMERYVSEFGVNSIKVFLNFRTDEGRFLGVGGTDDEFLVRLLDTAAKLGVMVGAHCESSELNRGAAAISGMPSDDLRSLSVNKPPFSEASAVAKLGYSAMGVGAKAYAVHVTSRLGLEAARSIKSLYPQFYTETCPQYLTLDVNSSCGSFGKASPPLRDREDCEALWRGIEEGHLDTVGSDHVARGRSAKDKPFAEASAGLPGLQTLLPLLLSAGHHQRGIPLRRLIDVCSTNPAKLFGLYPKKGTLRIGADADIAMVDLDAEEELSDARQYSYAGFTPWAGLRVRGVVRRTMLRGAVVYDSQDGSVVSQPPRGAYIRRPV